MTTVTDATLEAGAGRPPGFAERLRAPDARHWYLGAGFGLLWQGILVASVILGSGEIALKALSLVVLAVFYAVFMVFGPLLQPESLRTKLAAVAAYWLASCVLFSLIGIETVWLWLLVVSMLAFVGLPLKASLPSALFVVLVQLAVAASADFADGTGFAPVVTTVSAISLIGIGALSASNDNLRVANEEIARLAVVAERARFGRDLHDVLGHSLTVIAVKSNLARRLVTIDPKRAETEIADVEQLTRSALADLRLAVANYREITLDAELTAAQTALAAAGIRAELPHETTVVEPALQAVFAWVVREGVTNVIRHSGATSCWVSVEADHLVIADDGRGPDAPHQRSNNGGHGLQGLRERAAQVGAVVQTRPSQKGGFELTATRRS